MSFKSLMLIISVVVGTVFAGNATAISYAGETTREGKWYKYCMKDTGKCTSKWVETREEAARNDERAGITPGGEYTNPKALNSFLK